MTGELFQIRIKGELDKSWEAWFEGLTITGSGQGETLITGLLPDQSALHGVLTRIRDLGLPLIALKRIDTDEMAN